VVNRKEEEEAKEMISLWKKKGKARESMGAILKRCRTVRRLYSYPQLHYCQYVPLDCTSGSVSGAKPSKPHITFQLCRKILVANFIPRRLQLQSSLPTSSLVANFNPHRLQLQPSSPFNFQTPSLFYFLPFSLMPAVCLMQLLPDELVTQIIIHSIKDKPVFHFLNLRNKICGTFRRICDSDEVTARVAA
jgi:hypothetical protein